LCENFRISQQNENSKIKKEVLIMKNTNKELDITSLKSIANEMNKIEKDMEWDKMCAIERKVDSLNDKMDLILQKLGDK
jgi:hypothetical protein